MGKGHKTQALKPCFNIESSPLWNYRASPLVNPAIVPSMPVSEFCRAIWLEQLVQMIAKQAHVANRDSKAVHDMRVAIRRIRAAEKLFCSQFHKRKIARFFKQLRHTGRLLGAVRDLDVALERLHTSHTSLDADLPDSALESLRTHWQDEREDAQHKLLAWLKSNSYTRFVCDFLEFCQTANAGSKPLPTRNEPPLPPYQLCHLLPAILQERYGRVRAFEAVLLIDDYASLETWHALRIECKILRYALEFAAPFLGHAGAQLIDHLKQLQNVLGDLNDSAVSADRISRLEKKAAGVEAYRQRQHLQIETHKLLARQSFHDFIAPANRWLLQRALTKL